MTIKHRFSQMKKNKGLVALISVIAAPFLILATGLAIDSGRAYLVKAKLFTAVDAAGIAAARAVSEGEDAARSAAAKMFTANLPNGYHESTTVSPTLSFGYDEFGNVSIDVSASAQVNTTFLGVFGYSTLNLNATAQTVRRPVDLVLVVDNTTSLRLGSIGDVTEDVIERSKDFISNFNENFDRVALVKYAYGGEVPVAFQSSRGHVRSDITSAIDAFNFGSWSNPQYTNASEGFYLALDSIRNVDNPANLKVIVFFTDGAPNTFSSEFDFTSTSTNYTGSIRSSDDPSGTPRGLWRHNAIATQLSGSGYQGSNIDDRIASLPDYYTPHNADATEFKVLNPDHPYRPVYQYSPASNSANDLFTRINRVARNLVEDMAEAARNEGIYVFTLGLGSALTSAAGPDNELGEDLLLRMANDPKLLDDADLADDYHADQLEGVYCHAEDEQALGPCFDEMLNVIIRLTL
ncbi:von Willebrand factor type A [Vibrio galatheae]|uniref:von Willebrand factor type A n=1 Tax=Vibrio galatheae TaxID=579748 RepID=A0A0F4NIM2_9VIBR|nr:vWA domain-containing protein [Vibrio galatheae]KJY82970.1 von Willebrand factor type A [Vibrio galatheae]